MKKSTHLSALLFLLFSINSLTLIAAEQGRWSRVDQGMSELDAEIDKLNGKPEVRVEERVVEKIVVKEVIKEVYVPVPVQVTTPTPVPVAQVIPEPEALPVEGDAITIEADGYVFELSACRLSHRNMKCNLRVMSPDNDGTLSIYSTSRYKRNVSRLFDSSGNEYLSNKIVMGNKSNNAFVKNRYIAGVTVSGTLHFENLNNNTRAIALIELGITNNVSGKNSLIKFRNVGLSI